MSFGRGSASAAIRLAGFRILRRLGRVLVLALASPGAAELPTPTGPNPVGTTSWILTDASRPETFAAPGTKRQVEVVAWYPAAAAGGGETAPYLRSGLAEARSLGILTGRPDDFNGLADLKTHSWIDAEIAAAPAKFPVLVFSHGYLAVPSSYTALLEDLASHGYVVLSIVHPYEASASTLADGTTATFLGPDHALRPEIRSVLDEWGREDEALKSVTETADRKDQLRRLRAYLSGLRQTRLVLERWVQAIRLVLDRLPSLPPATLPGRLAARLDLGRVGVFGHSMGGVSAGQFCLEDPRCLAGLNLDGSPQSGTMIDGRLKRPFLMVYSGRPGRLGANDAIYAKAASAYYRVDVAGALHLEFSDMPFWTVGGLRDRGAFGTISPTRAAMITRAIVREYFDQTLLMLPSPLLGGQAILPEVRVHPLEASR
jgi:predicted dienelactone hydrolase